jgi:membrane-associated phospholipid phosphatase
MFVLIFITVPASASEPFVGSKRELGLTVGLLVSAALLEWKPINNDHPFIGGKQISYTSRERVPDWMIGVMHLSAAGAIWLNPNKDDRKRFGHGYEMATSINAFATALTKAVVGRRRPNYDAALHQGVESNSKSFYSGHSSNSFMAATYLSLYTLRSTENRFWRLTLPTLFYSGATYTAWSRVADHRHYPSDVIVGAVAGSTVGMLVFRWYDGMQSTKTESVARFVPYPGGIMLTTPI